MAAFSGLCCCGAPVGPSDADIFINLAKKHHSVDAYLRQLRAKLDATYPSTQFQFLPADIVSQILNFGLPSPLDIQVSGPNVKANREFIKTLLPQVSSVPGAADMHIKQAYDYPQIDVDVDRSKAQLLGLTEQNVAYVCSALQDVIAQLDIGRGTLA